MQYQPRQLVSITCVGVMIAGLSVTGLYTFFALRNLDGLFLIVFAAAISALIRLGKK